MALFSTYSNNASYFVKNQPRFQRQNAEIISHHTCVLMGGSWSETSGQPRYEKKRIRGSSWNWWKVSVQVWDGSQYPPRCQRLRIIWHWQAANPRRCLDWKSWEYSLARPGTKGVLGAWEFRIWHHRFLDTSIRAPLPAPTSTEEFVYYWFRSNIGCLSCVSAHCGRVRELVSQHWMDTACLRKLMCTFWHTRSAVMMIHTINHEH